MTTKSKHSEGSFVKIPFQDKNYRLTLGWLKDYSNAAPLFNRTWRWPSLKFISFKQGQLELLNTSEDRSYNLTLMVRDKQLFVRCNCAVQSSSLCGHAHSALHMILLYLGEHYFATLQPDGAMTLAFAHKRYFDKQESTAGIKPVPRPELKSVFRISPEVEMLDLNPVLRLPAKLPNTEPAVTETVLSYLIINPFRNNFLTALLPCTGRLNKNRTDIKSWNRFLAGTEKNSNQVLTGVQNGINITCFHLWKLVEKSSGSIVEGNGDKETDKNLTAIFTTWQKLLPQLQNQPFVYLYLFYGMRELRRKPAKARLERVVVSNLVPSLEFELVDKGVFYRFQMRFRINGKLIADFDADVTFFIQHQQTLYMLSSLRDAALAQWLDDSGGWITVFKEHFTQFERQVLVPLRKNYTIVIKPSKRKKQEQ